MIKVGAMTYAKLIKELVDGPWSFLDMATNTGLHYHTVREYVNALHKEGVIHIAGWEKDRWGRDCKPLWVFGVGRDKTRAKLTQAQRQARHRAKVKGMTNPMHMLGTIDKAHL